MSRRASVLSITLWLLGAGCGGEEEATSQVPDPVDQFVGRQVLLLMMGYTVMPAIHCVGKGPTECCRFKVRAPARYGRCDVDAALLCDKLSRTSFTMEWFQHAQDTAGPFRLGGDLALQSAASPGFPVKTTIRGTLSVLRGDTLARAGTYDVTVTSTKPSPMALRTCVQGTAFGVLVNECTSYGVGSP